MVNLTGERLARAMASKQFRDGKFHNTSGASADLLGRIRGGVQCANSSVILMRAKRAEDLLVPLFLRFRSYAATDDTANGDGSALKNQKHRR